MQWVKFGGYHEDHKYIDEDECIVGTVSGSPFHTEGGWYAVCECGIPAMRLGRYLTLDAAKAALEKRYREINTGTA